MKLKPSTQGGTLILAMLVVVVFTGIVAVGQLLSSNQILLTTRSADVDSMQATGEGLAQYAYGVWRDAMTSATTPLTTAQATALVASANRPSLPGWMQCTSFTITALDTAGNDAASPDKIPSLSQDPKGWQANSYEYAARITLTSKLNRKPATVTVEALLRHDLVPPVGGLFFCEGDFELYKPAPMLINGNVHTNANGYVSTSGTTTATKLEFSADSNVSYVGAYSQAAPPGAAHWSAVGSAADVGMPIFDRGFGSQVSQVNAVEGIGMGTATQYNPNDANPNNDSNRELIERPVSGTGANYTDPPGIANSRLFNNAGLVVDIAGPVTGTIAPTQTSTGVYSGNNVTITAKNGTSLTATAAKAIITAISNATTTTTTAYNSTLKKNVTTTTTSQSTVFDKRESASVLISDLDLGAVNSTLNTLSGFNNILYINNTAQAAGSAAAVRLTDAGVLPTNGLTVATEGGLYVVGDYNTGTTTNPNLVPSNSTGNPNGTSQPYVTGYTTKPAALVADAVMFLSNNWDDSNASSSLSSRVASNTTINSAIIAGYIPSNWTNPDDPTADYYYSGGANNFPRFLETWNSKTMTFNGAMVQLFKSKIFTGPWDTGDIYLPPTRRWSFDKLLLSRVIPGIPAASSFSIEKVRTL